MQANMAVNSTTGSESGIGMQGTSSSLTSQSTLPDNVMATQHDEVLYAKPDTTTDEASLLSYQVKCNVIMYAFPY